MYSSVTNDRCREYRGLSTDTKPTEIAKNVPLGNGSSFLEMDTSKLFMWDEANKKWVELQ